MKPLDKTPDVPDSSQFQAKNGCKGVFAMEITFPPNRFPLQVQLWSEANNLIADDYTVFVGIVGVPESND